VLSVGYSFGGTFGKTVCLTEFPTKHSLVEYKLSMCPRDDRTYRCDQNHNVLTGFCELGRDDKFSCLLESFSPTLVQVFTTH